MVAGYIFYNRWLDVFPQIEFRTWLFSGAGLKWYLVSVFTHQGAFSQSSPYAADNATRAICGLSIRCVNTPGFLTILLAGYLLFWLIVRFTGSVIGATVGATLWVLSLPVLDGFSWQSTFGDRLATLFGLVTVHVALSAMRWVGQRPTLGRIAIANVCVLVPAIITYNSKAISWLVLPSLVLLAIALTDGWTFSAIVQRASVLAATAVYATFRTVDMYVLLGESPASRNLSFGGAPAHSAKLYLAFLTNHMFLTTIPHLLVLIAVAGILIATWGYRTASPQARSQIRIMWWAILSLAGGLCICLFTSAPTPYLLLLPSTFLWVALIALWRSVRMSHSIARPIVDLGIVAAGTAVMLLGLSGSYAIYGAFLSWAHNFRRSVPVIARDVPIGAPTDFVIGEAPFDAYRFLGDDGQRVIDEFIYHRTGTASLLAAEARMTNVTTPPSSFSGYSVVFGNDMIMTEILHGSRVIYRALTPDGGR